jgi:hypothetical protein
MITLVVQFFDPLIRPLTTTAYTKERFFKSVSATVVLDTDPSQSLFIIALDDKLANGDDIPTQVGSFFFATQFRINLEFPSIGVVEQNCVAGHYDPTAQTITMILSDQYIPTAGDSDTDTATFDDIFIGYVAYQTTKSTTLIPHHALDIPQDTKSAVNTVRGFPGHRKLGIVRESVSKLLQRDGDVKYFRQPI